MGTGAPGHYQDKIEEAEKESAAMRALHSWLLLLKVRRSHDRFVIVLQARVVTQELFFFTDVTASFPLFVR